jgi:3-oxoacyl-[acyl-carrier protein] reductase
MTPSTLDGRVALVTGASGGIGAALARGLAAAGTDLLLAHGSHDVDDLVAELRATGRRVLAVSADAADPDAAAALVDRAEAELGPVDVLVPAAGAGEQTDWREVDVGTWDRVMAVNTRAPWLLAQRVLPGMLERGFGRILFVSSVAALNGGVIGPHYAASKAALHGLMHHLAPRVAGAGVTVNTLAPALVAGTRMLPADPDDPDAMPLPIPVGRLGTTAEQADFALAVLRNGYLTNKVLPLDGGLVAT